MNNLFDFLRRNAHFILFIILQILCIIMITRNMNYSRSVVSTTCQTITGPINRTWYKLVRHFNLEEENKDLIQQNILLMQQMENVYITKSDTILTATDTSKAALYEKRSKLYDYTYADIIYKSTNKTHNYIIIDKGKEDGVTLDMAAISPNGVVGVVNDVSTHFASILPVLHPDSRISAKIMPVNQMGTVMWDGSDPSIAYLHDIPQHLSVKVGDTVLTSGFSNFFPKDIMIGTVLDKKNNTKNSFYTIRIKLSVDFTNINTVYLVTNLYKPELDSLKNRFKNE